MRFTDLILLVIFVGVVPRAMAAIEKDPLSDVVSSGVKHAFSVETEKLTLEEAHNKLSISYSAVLPTLTLSAGQTLGGSQSVDSTSGDVTYASNPVSQLNLTASWTLWDNYKSIRNIEITKKDLDRERINSDRVVQKYVLDLLTAYLEYQMLLSEAETLKSRLEQSRLTNEESQALVKAGAKTRMDAMDTEIEVANTERDILEAENGIANAERSLRVLINFEQMKNLPRMDLLKQEPYFIKDFDHRIAKLGPNWKDQLKDINQDIKIQKYSLEESQMNLAQAKLAYFPTTQLVLTHQYTMDSYLQSNPTAGRRVGLNGDSIALTLSWPIWDWWSTPNTIANVQKEHEIKILQYRQANLEKQAEIDSLYRQLEVLKKTVEVSRMVLEKAEAQLRYSREMYRLGRLTLLQMQQSISRVSDARNSLASRLKDRNIAVAKLLYDAGLPLTPPGIDLSWIH